MKFDDILVDHIGQFGRYQQLMVAVLASVGIISAFDLLDIVFAGAVPEFWCEPPHNIGGIANLSHTELLNLTSPLGKKGFDVCKTFVYQGNISDVAEANLQIRNGNVTEKKCEKWYYDTSQYTLTTVSQWDLVCDRKVLIATTQSVFMAGYLVGTLISGIVSDRFGRRVVFVVSANIILMCRITAALSPTLFLYVTAKFGVAASSMALYTSAFILATELVGPKWRLLVGILFTIFWGVGYVTIAGVAFFLRNRIVLELVLTLPILPYIFFLWVLPESPRWLYTQGRKDEAQVVLSRVAKYNKTILPKMDLLDEEKHVQEEKGGKDSLPQVLKSCRLLARYGNVMFLWFSLGFTYYGITLSSENMAGNLYLNISLAGAVEIAAVLLCQLSMSSPLGRQKSLLTSMLLSGAILLCIFAVPEEKGEVRTALSMIGKGSVTFAFAGVYVYTAELFPTDLRNWGVGTSSALARVGAIIAPFVPHLGRHNAALPSVTFGIVSMVSGIFLILLPETKDKPLPQTVQDAHNMRGMVTCSKSLPDKSNSLEIS